MQAHVGERRGNHNYQCDDEKFKYLIRAEESNTKFIYVGEKLPETLFNAMLLIGLLLQYEHFVVQESFTPDASFLELRTRLTKYEESQAARGGDEKYHKSMSAIGLEIIWFNNRL